ncbi:MAG: hypothetical protein V6Z86_05440 [Hyphomicrobiales bacterium]
MADFEIKILVHKKTEERPDGYVSAGVSYAPLPGEDWRRGNDLADGPCDKETLERIKEDIDAVFGGYRNRHDRVEQRG